MRARRCPNGRRRTIAWFPVPRYTTAVCTQRGDVVCARTARCVVYCLSLKNHPRHTDEIFYRKFPPRDRGGGVDEWPRDGVTAVLHNNNNIIYVGSGVDTVFFWGVWGGAVLKGTWEK